MNERQQVAACVCLLAAVFSTAPVGAGLTRHDQTRDAYIERGRQPEFACVGKLVIKDKESGKDKASGTGVLIAPGWLLTAAHVARQGKLEDHRWVFRGEPHQAVQRVLHPSYRPDRDAEVAAKAGTWH